LFLHKARIIRATPKPLTRRSNNGLVCCGTNRRFMAHGGHANVPAGCLLLGVKRKTSAAVPKKFQ
jgi:hypothetical protein